MSKGAGAPDLVVVGAGAAGLWLAGSAAEAALLEREALAGASGGGEEELPCCCCGLVAEHTCAWLASMTWDGWDRDQEQPVKSNRPGKIP